MTKIVGYSDNRPPYWTWDVNEMFWVHPDSEIKTDHIRIVMECKGCHARCCGMDTVIYEDEFGKYDTVPSPRGDHEQMLRKNPETGLCVYSVEGKCSIYATRPISCKQWSCMPSGGPDRIWNLLRPPGAPAKLKDPESCKTCGGLGSVKTPNKKFEGCNLQVDCPDCRPPPSPGLLNLFEDLHGERPKLDANEGKIEYAGVGEACLEVSRKDVPDLEIVKQALALKERKHTNLVDRLVAVCDQPKKVVYAALDRALERGYIEYGTTIRQAWPTEKGLALLDKEKKTA